MSAKPITAIISVCVNLIPEKKNFESAIHTSSGRNRPSIGTNEPSMPITPKKFIALTTMDIRNALPALTSSLYFFPIMTAMKARTAPPTIVESIMLTPRVIHDSKPAAESDPLIKVSIGDAMYNN